MRGECLPLARWQRCGGLPREMSAAELGCRASWLALTRSPNCEAGLLRNARLCHRLRNFQGHRGIEVEKKAALAAVAAATTNGEATTHSLPGSLALASADGDVQNRRA